MEVLVSLLQFLFFSTLFAGMPILIVYIAVRYTINKSRKERMSKIDFEKDKDYYREILRKYSPQELSYIDDFKIEIPRDIVAIILNLKLKNKIEIEKNRINIIDNNEEELNETEKIILSKIKDGKVKIDDVWNIESCVKKEAMEDKLIEENKKEKQNAINMVSKIVVIAIIMITIFFIIYNNIENVDKMENNTIIYIMIYSFYIIFFVAFISLPVVFLTYVAVHADTTYVRTQKGEDINKKIEGLKQYLKDYSLLEEKEKNEIVVWEEYLIYSVIFGLNDKILEEISSLIEIECKYINL